MRLTFAVLILLCGVLGFTGCESSDSFSTHVRERFEAPQPQTRVYEVGQRAVFDAVQTALRRMDFRVTRARAAQGTIAALSRIQPGESFGVGRQYAFDITVREVEANRTELSVVLRVQEESASFAGATDLPVRDHGLYGSLFEATAHVLRENAPKK